VSKFIWILIHYIPIVYLSLFGGLIFLSSGSPRCLITVIIFGIYLVPPLISRLAFLILPTPGRHDRVPSQNTYSWWIASQLQLVYLRFPVLEEILRMIPGLYSSWLRLWGAKIGKFVYWAPGVVVADRSHLEVGNFVLFGYGSKLTAHAFLKRSHGRETLIFSAPKIGDNALIGALSGIGPGCQIAAHSTLPSHVILSPFTTWSETQGKSVRISKTKQ
jgi:uncharacterized membrane protein YhaH (DUF805 family)